MSKLHIVYDTLADTAHPKRKVEQFALCGTYTPTGEQMCLDSPLWGRATMARAVCKRCKAKAEKLTETVDGKVIVKPGLVVPTVGRR